MPRDFSSPPSAFTPNLTLIIITLVAALGAINTAIIGIFNFNLVIYLTGRVTDLAEPLYFLIGFCGTCLLTINIKFFLTNVMLK